MVRFGESMWGTSNSPRTNFTGESGGQLIIQPDRVWLLYSDLDR